MKNDGAHGTLLFVIGAYIVYLGIDMMRTTRQRISSMSMTTTIILMSVLVLAGLAVVGYGVHLFLQGWKQQQMNDNTDEKEEDEET